MWALNQKIKKMTPNSIINERRFKNMKFNKNKLYKALPLLLVLSVVLVSAAVMVYYGQVKSTVNVEQPIIFTVDGLVKTGIPATENVDCDAGKTCVGILPYRVINNGDSDKTVALVISGNTNEVDVSYVGVLTLSSKDDCYAEGTCTLDETTTATLQYTIVGDEFKYKLESEDITLSDYTLVYYPEVGYDSGDYTGIVVPITEGIGSLPFDTDLNKVDNEYCTNGKNPEDSKCYGAKLWLVPTANLNSEKTHIESWAGDIYLFETNLIQYFDNANGEITIPAGDYIEFYPQFSVDSMDTTGSYVVYTTVNNPTA